MTRGKAGRFRRAIWREDRQAFEEFTRQLGSMVKRLAIVLAERFDDFRSGLVGEEVKSITLSLFERWCQQSITPPPPRTLETLKPLLDPETARLETIRKALGDLGFS